MALEATPLSVASDGNLRVAVVPSGANALSVAILTGGTTKLITYSLTPDGFNRGVTENTVDDPRLSLKQTFSRPGTSTETLELKYVFGDTNDVAKPALTEGLSVQIVDRRSIDNAVDWTIGQKVDVLTVILGKQRKDAPAANGIQTITQTAFVISATKYDQALIA
jgi:hypothetical protein